METVGKKVVKLNFAKGFSAQFATAMSVNLGSVMGLPLSTTHCIVGALFGLSIMQKIGWVPTDDQEESAEKKRNIPEDMQVPTNDFRHSQVKPLGNTIDDSKLLSFKGNESKDKTADSKDPADVQPVEMAFTSGQTPEEIEEQKLKDKKEKRKTVGRIIFFWAITVPVALIVAFALTKLLLI